MPQRPQRRQIELPLDLHCKDCRWPVVSIKCNRWMGDPYSPHMFWIFCINVECFNHHGAPYDADLPAWIGGM